MGGRVIVVVKNKLKVVNSEGPLADSGCTPHPHATLKSTANDGRVPGFFDCREVGFELLGDA